MKNKSRVDPEYIEDEINYNVYTVEPNKEQITKETLKLLKGELLEIIETYIDPLIR